MRQFSLASIAIFSSLLVTQAVADPLDDAIALFKRQTSIDLNTGVSTTTSVEETTLPEPSTTPITTPDEVPATTTTIPNPNPEPSTVIETSTSTRQPDPTPTDETNTQPETEPSEETQTSLTRITSSVTSQIVTTFTTVTDGSTLIGTSTSETVMATTTDVDPASLSDGGSSGGSSGLSDNTKKTIGGVVGGIGGALLLAGLAYTAWRIWGKKKNLHDDDLYDPNVPSQDKLSSSTADNPTGTPFNRTLDQYHNPGPVNQASNF